MWERYWCFDNEENELVLANHHVWSSPYLRVVSPCRLCDSGGIDRYLLPTIDSNRRQTLADSSFQPIGNLSDRSLHRIQVMGSVVHSRNNARPLTYFLAFARVLIHQILQISLRDDIIVW